MSFHYSYAQLGQSCQTDFSVLTDNSKFYPLDEPLYNVPYTKMNTFPAYVTDKDKLQNKEIKKKKEKCCGN